MKSIRFLFMIIAALSLFGISCVTTGNLEENQSTYSFLDEFMQEKGYPKVPTSFPEFYYDGRTWKAELLQLIEESQETILVSTFLGNEHFATNDIWLALKRKAEQGVVVYIMLDACSQVQAVPNTHEYVKSALPMLKEMGMNVVEYNSFSLSNAFFMPALLNRDHRKFFVFDSKIVALGGMNINHTSLYYPEGTGHIDLMAVVESPELAHIASQSFVDTYNRYSSKLISVSAVYQQKTVRSSEFSAYVLDYYKQENSAVKDLFDAFALVAEKQLWMVQEYTFLTPSLTRRIKYLADKGVSVNVVLSENASADKYWKSAFYNVLPLIDAGATVYFFNSPDQAFLHQKMTIADNRYVSFGSANYNYRSHAISRELNLFYDDQGIAEALTAFISSILPSSRIISRDEAKQWRSLSFWYYHVLMQFWG